MTFKEFKEFEEKVKEWGEKYNHKSSLEIYPKYIEIVIGGNAFVNKICAIHRSERFVIDFTWKSYIELPENERNDLFKIVTEFSATKIKDREDEKKFIIPLPMLVTTDGKQQYLTYKDCRFFASRRDENLRQIWREEHLKSVPKFYRQLAVELDEWMRIKDDV